MAHHTPSSKPPQRRSTLSGKVVAGGTKTRSRAAWLLGLNEHRNRFSVKAVSFGDHRMRVAVRMAGQEEVIFSIDARKGDEPGVVVTEHLVLSHSGEIPFPVVRILQEVASKRLSTFTIEKLEALVASDPESGAPGQPVISSEESPDRPRFLLDTWGEGNAWADFFAGGELARGQLDSLDPTSLFVFAQHSDAECNNVNPHGIAPIVSFVSFPWEERIRSDRTVRTPPSMEMGAVDQLLSTDLTERDVIMGNRDKVGKVLKKGVEISQKLGKTLFFSNTCVPVVTGEDVESQVKGCKEGCNCGLLYLTVTPRSMVNVFEDVLITRRLEAERKASAPEPNWINLVGFQDNPGTRELIGLLQSLGVHVNVSFIPNLRAPDVEKLPRAGLCVTWPNSTWNHLYEQLQQDSRMRFISPPTPFGLEGTRNWASTICKELGMEVGEEFEAKFQAYLSPEKEALERLMSQASQKRLGFVVRARETYYLHRPEFTWGIPLIPMLEELGFTFDILLHLETRAQAVKAAEEVRIALAKPDLHTVRGFNSLEMMLQRMTESQAQAFLTYHTFDWRVTQAGKSVFSLQQFEPGVPGARRTLERLLGICDNPFFSRYAAYLKRTPEGLRITPDIGGEL